MGSTPPDATVTDGSGNVFHDLGFEDADELLAKAQLASAISDIIDIIYSDVPRSRLGSTSTSDRAGTEC